MHDTARRLLVACLAALAACGDPAEPSAPRLAGEPSLARAGAGAALLQPNAEAPTVTLTSSANPSVYRQAVTLTATVSGAGAVPSGFVTFSDGATTLCGAPLPLSGGGTASCTVNPLAVATHPLTATYSGDATYLAGAAALAQVVQPAATATALTASTFSPVYGQPLTLTATVSVLAPGGGAPAGAVAFQEGATTWCAAAPLAGATATCTLPATLATGAHTFTASFLGSTEHAASDSPGLNRTVTAAEATVAMATSGSPSAYGAPVTFTATVGGPAGPPTGAVTFSSGGTTLCASVALDAGVARCTTSALAPGSRIVTGGYGGDANHAAASAFVTQVVNAGTPTVAASASPDPSTYGQAVTLTAAVAGAGAVPTGTVAFSEGGTTLCSATLDAAGVGACTSATLAVGAHAVAAQYQGDARYDPAAGAVTVTVGQAAVSVVLGSSANPATYAAATTFTATVSGPGSTPTGAVTFRDGATVLCGGPVAMASGRAACTLSGAAGLAGGTHSLTAAYGGSASHLPGDSAPLAQVVAPAASTLALATSGTPSVYGAPVTFTATLGGAGVPPGGSVSFTDNGTPLCGPVAAAGGVATCTTGALARGTHTIGASSSGDPSYLGASASRVQVVTQATPTIALLASPAASVFGEEVTLTVSVGGAGAVPTGTVTVYEGGNVLCGGPLPLAAGTAACRKADFGAGDHYLAATYSGDANYGTGSPGGLVYTVQRAPTAVALDAGPAGAVYGQPVTLTATVTVPPPGAGLPSGPVDFYDGATLVGTAALDPATGLATLTVPAGHLLGAGSHDLTAAYGGDASFQGSLSDAVAGFLVGQATPLVAVTATPSPSVFGEAVAITVDVAAQAPGGGTAGGIVLVSLDGGAPVELTLAGGSATLAVPALEVGDHAVAVSYPGDANFLPGAATSAHAVGRAATAVTATAGPSPSVYGQPVTFAAAVAAVAPGSGTPTGAVRLVLDGAEVARGTLDAAGTARLTLATLPVGAHTLAVEYPGDGRYLGGQGTVDHLVLKAFTDVTVAVSDSLTVYGAPVTVSAAVTPAFFGVGAPTGAVSFVEGTTVLAVVPLDVVGRASFTTTELAPGGHLIEAAYAGDAAFLDGTSLPASTSILPASVSVSLAVGPNPSVAGETVAWTVRVQAASPSVAVPQGTVEIIEAGGAGARPTAGETVVQTLTLDAAGVATGGSAGLTPGLHLLAARFVGRYPGDDRFTATNQPAVTQQVARAATAVALSAAPSPSTFGAVVTFTARVAVQAPGAGTPSGTVTFTADGQALGAAALDAAGEARLDAAGLHAGAHQVVASYAGDAAFLPGASTTFTQAVLPAATAASATATPAASVYGQPVAFTAVVTTSAGVPTGRVEFRENGVTLGIATLDAGGRATFTKADLAVGGHAVVASYLGDADHQAVAADPVGVAVSPASTGTTLAASPAAAVAGQPITLTAEVLPVAPGAGLPTGRVTFRDGASDLGSAPVDGATLRATLALASLPVGAHALTASYPGDGRFLASASGPAVPLQVDRAGASVAVGVEPAAPVTGQPVIATAVVTASAPGAGTPTGQVTFSDGATPLGTATLAGGRASLATALAGGSRALQVAYAGDAAFQPGAGSATVVVGRATTTTTLATTGSPSIFGQPLTLTATVQAVAPGAGAPGGEVTFRDGATTLATAPVGAGGVATLAPALAVGTHALTAEYGGDAGFSPSSAALQQEVNAAPVALRVTASPSPAEYGEPVSVAVTVAPQGAGGGTPAGTVTLYDGARRTGTATLAAGAATFPLPGLAAGLHQLTVTYAGGGGFAPGSTAVELEIRPAATTLAVQASRSPIRAGQTVRLTVTATSGHATPTGTVALKDGPVVIGTVPLADGVATLRTRALRKGSHTITAQLAASGGFAAGAGALPEPLVVENSPPVAGSGAALVLGPGHAWSASAPPATALETAAGTVELWFRAGWTAAAEVGAHPSLARLGGDAGDRWALGVTPDRAGITVTLGATTTTIPAAVGDGWHHLALAAGADAATVFLDGVEIGAIDGRLGAAAGAALSVGEGFLGEIDELRLWSTVRGAAALAADARRPLSGGEAGLLGLWRMDEGSGADLFDAGPAGADLAAVLDAGAPGATAFGPSGAWRRRSAPPGRPMTPMVAGYDADGDPLVLEAVTAPAHGTATYDQVAQQIAYRPEAGYTGPDLLAWRLSEGDGGTSEYAVELSVAQPAACVLDTDCGAGTTCVAGACRAAAGGGGCGCTSGGGALALWSMVALALAAWRRPRRTARR